MLVVSWSPDAKYLASGDMDGNILLWDPADGKLLGSCSGHKKWITSLVRASAPLRARLCHRVRCGPSCSLWPGRGGESHISSALCCPPLPQAWEPAHRALPVRRFVSGSKDMTVRVWDAGTRRCLFSMSSHTMVWHAHARIGVGFALAWSTMHLQPHHAGTAPQPFPPPSA